MEERAGEQTGLTNNGQIKFSVPRMRYDWVASKQYFSDQTGVVQPNDLPKTVNVAMPRKETRVQFYVYNSDTGLPVSGASVKPEGLSTQNTGSDGTTTFTMQMGKTYKYEVSVYDYQPTEGSVTVNQETMPQQRVGVSNKTYSAHITVKSRNGYNINRAYVTYGGKSGYTNSQGQLTLTGIQSGISFMIISGIPSSVYFISAETIYILVSASFPFEKTNSLSFLK
jgi:hypothetical protein